MENVLEMSNGSEVGELSCEDAMASNGAAAATHDRHRARACPLRGGHVTAPTGSSTTLNSASPETWCRRMIGMVNRRMQTVGVEREAGEGTSLRMNFAAIATGCHKVVVLALTRSLAQELSSEFALHEVTAKTIPGSGLKTAHQSSSAIACDSADQACRSSWTECRCSGREHDEDPKCYNGETCGNHPDK